MPNFDRHVTDLIKQATDRLIRAIDKTEQHRRKLHSKNMPCWVDDMFANEVDRDEMGTIHRRFR